MQHTNVTYISRLPEEFGMVALQNNTSCGGHGLRTRTTLVGEAGVTGGRDLHDGVGQEPGKLRHR